MAGKRQRKYQPWACEECKAGYPRQCVRPAQCDIARERRAAAAELMLDSMKEDGVK